MLKFLIDKTLLLGCVVIKTELRIGMEILLSEISAIDRGQSLYYLLKKQPEILPSLLEICAKDQKNFEMCALLLLHKDSQISSRRSLAVDLACNSYTVATTVLSCRPCFFLQVITFHLLHNQDAELWIYGKPYKAHFLTSTSASRQMPVSSRGQSQLLWQACCFCKGSTEFCRGHFCLAL